MINVENKMKIYEIDGVDPGFDTSLTVTSHWNRQDFVTIRTPGVKSKSYTVCAQDLLNAVANATNTGRL